MKVLVETCDMGDRIPKVFKAKKDTYKQIKKRLYKAGRDWGYVIKPHYHVDEATDLAKNGLVFFKTSPRRKDGPSSEIHAGPTEGMAILKPTYVHYHWYVVDMEVR